MFTLTIRTDNDAFQDAPAMEVARILRQEADRLEDGAYDVPKFRTVFDVNGNDVGRAKLDHTPSET